MTMHSWLHAWRQTNKASGLPPFPSQDRKASTGTALPSYGDCQRER